MFVLIYERSPIHGALTTLECTSLLKYELSQSSQAIQTTEHKQECNLSNQFNSASAPRIWLPSSTQLPLPPPNTIAQDCANGSL